MKRFIILVGALSLLMTGAVNAKTVTVYAGPPGNGMAKKLLPKAVLAVNPDVNAFFPQTVTIHVGDTVTWTNAGPSEHSATAYDHSFNTGLLKKGSSASHTFTQAGTVTYFCSIHPFMHGTVVVK